MGRLQDFQCSSGYAAPDPAERTKLLRQPELSCDAHGAGSSPARAINAWAHLFVQAASSNASVRETPRRTKQPAATPRVSAAGAQNASARKQRFRHSKSISVWLRAGAFQIERRLPQARRPKSRYPRPFGRAHHRSSGCSSPSEPPSPRAPVKPHARTRVFVSRIKSRKPGIINVGRALENLPVHPFPQ